MEYVNARGVDLGPGRHRLLHGSDEAFLRRLWHELYGDEPLEAPPSLFDPDLEFRAAAQRV